MAVIKRKRSVTQFQVSFLEEKVFTTLFIIILKKFKEAIDKKRRAFCVVVTDGSKEQKKEGETCV